MRKFVLILAVVACCVSACQNISCPLDNVVMLKMSMYSGDEKARVLDTLTVTLEGRDSVLVNRIYNFDEVQLPLRQNASGEVTDTFLLHWSLATGEESETPVRVTDTLTVRHGCTVHFESMDCPSSVFHHLIDATCSRGLADSVSINNPAVDYEHYENLRLYLSPLSE